MWRLYGSICENHWDIIVRTKLATNAVSLMVSSVCCIGFFFLCQISFRYDERANSQRRPSHNENGTFFSFETMKAPRSAVRHKLDVFYVISISETSKTQRNPINSPMASPVAYNSVRFRPRTMRQATKTVAPLLRWEKDSFQYNESFRNRKICFMG